MPVTPGSSAKINTLRGIHRQLYLSNADKGTYGDRVFEANIFIVGEDKKIYLTDGVTALNALEPIIDTNIAPLSEAMRTALNNTFSGDSGAYKATEGGFVVLGAAGGDGNPKIADAQLNLVDADGHLVSTYLQDVLTDENGIILLDKLPDQMRRHMVFVANYAAIAGLTATQKLDLIFVTDASDDPSGSVTSGWAVYAFNVQEGAATGDPIKLMEGEGLDIDFDAISASYENVQKAGAVMYDHTIQLEAPSMAELVAFLDTANDTVYIASKPENYSGSASQEVACGLALAGTESGSFTVTLTGSDAQLKDPSGANTPEASVTKTDTLDNINTWLAQVVVVLGASSGTVTVDSDKMSVDTVINTVVA